MKPNDFLTEQQLDELDIKALAQKGAKALGNVGKGIGAVAGIPQGIGRAIKSGYKSGVDAIGGSPEQSSADDTTGATIDQQINQKYAEIAALKKQQATDAAAQDAPGIGTKVAQGATTAMNAVGNVGRATANSIERGKHGLAGASDTSYLQKSQAAKGAANRGVDSNMFTGYDKLGRPSQYRKVNGEWVDVKGVKVDPAFAQSIEQQIKDKQAATTTPPDGERIEPTFQEPAQVEPVAQPAAMAPQAFPKRANGSTLNYHPETGEEFATPADAQSFLDAKLKADPNYGQPAAKAATPDFSKALMGQNTGYGKTSYNVPTGASPTIKPAMPGATNPAQKTAAPAAASNVPKIQPAMPGAVTPAPLTDKTGRVSPAAAAAHQEKVKAAWAAQHPGVPMPTNEGKNFSAILWKQMREGK